MQKRFMSNQDILEFLHSIANQSKALMSLFETHDGEGGQYTIEPSLWEQQALASTNPANCSSVPAVPHSEV